MAPIVSGTPSSLPLYSEAVIPGPAGVATDSVKVGVVFCRNASNASGTPSSLPLQYSEIVLLQPVRYILDSEGLLSSSQGRR